MRAHRLELPFGFDPAVDACGLPLRGAGQVRWGATGGGSRFPAAPCAGACLRACIRIFSPSGV